MTSKREHVDGKGEVEDGGSINGGGRDEEEMSSGGTVEGRRQGRDVVKYNLMG